MSRGYLLGHSRLEDLVWQSQWPKNWELGICQYQPMVMRDLPWQHTLPERDTLHSPLSGQYSEINIRETQIQGASTHIVNGLIGECGSIISDGMEEIDWFAVSTLKEPYRIEGKKTMGLELAEQMDWNLPDVIFYPTGGGLELLECGSAFTS